jgi:hypothetical protein
MQEAPVSQMQTTGPRLFRNKKRRQIEEWTAQDAATVELEIGEHGVLEQGTKV